MSRTSEMGSCIQDPFAFKANPTEERGEPSGPVTWHGPRGGGAWPPPPTHEAPPCSTVPHHPPLEGKRRKGLVFLSARGHLLKPLHFTDGETEDKGLGSRLCPSCESLGLGTPTLSMPMTPQALTVEGGVSEGRVQLLSCPLHSQSALASARPYLLPVWAALLNSRRELRVRMQRVPVQRWSEETHEKPLTGAGDSGKFVGRQLLLQNLSGV